MDFSASVRCWEINCGSGRDRIYVINIAQTCLRLVSPLSGEPAPQRIRRPADPDRNYRGARSSLRRLFKTVDGATAAPDRGKEYWNRKEVPSGDGAKRAGGLELALRPALQHNGGVWFG